MAVGNAGGKQHAVGNSNHINQHKTMGDKSPKANQKKSSQKQSKVNTATQAKQQAVANKQSSNKK